MQRGQRLVLAVLSTALSTGGLTACLSERSYEPPNPLDGRGRFELPVDQREQRVVDDVDDVDVGDDIDLSQRLISEVLNARLVGDIGPATNLDAVPNTLNVYDDGYYAAIEAVAVRPERAAMLMVSTSSPRLVFAEGSRTFRLGEYQDDGAEVYALGCTGATEGYYDEFDYPADEVDVIVEEPGDTPGDVVVQVNARWTTAYPGETRSATSSFTLRH
jgi:hypothetical protein